MILAEALETVKAEVHIRRSIAHRKLANKVFRRLNFTVVVVRLMVEVTEMVPTVFAEVEFVAKVKRGLKMTLHRIYHFNETKILLRNEKFSSLTLIDFLQICCPRFF